MGKLKLILAFLLLFAVSAAAQESVKISTLPSATTPIAGSELLYIIQGGASKKIAASFLGTLAPLATTSQLYGGTGAANVLGVVNVGNGLSLTGGTLATSSTGTGAFSSLLVTSNDPYTYGGSLVPATPSGNVISIGIPWMVPGYLVTDLTTPSAIPAGTFVTLVGINNITLNNPVSGLLAGDTLSFQAPIDFLFLSPNNHPCERLTGGMAGFFTGQFFDSRCNPGGWFWQYNGVLRAEALQTDLGSVMTLNNGYDGGAYIPSGEQAVEFPVGFTISNANGNFPLNSERMVDGGSVAPIGRVYQATASNTWMAGDTTIPISGGCAAGFGLGINPGELLLDPSLATGTSIASVIGTIQSCTSTSITLVAGALYASAGSGDALIGIFQASYSWGSSNAGFPPDTLAIPLNVPSATCNLLNNDRGDTVTDLSIPGTAVVGSLTSTGRCTQQVVLTANATKGANGASDNLLFALPATRAWTTDTQIAVGGCGALASPQVLIDVTVSGNPNIGAVSTCASPVLALAAGAAHASSGSSDSLLFANQATAAWTGASTTVQVAFCNPLTPRFSSLLDLNIAGAPIISSFRACDNPTTLHFDGVPTQSSSGAADTLVWSVVAYQTWAPGSSSIRINTLSGCSGVVPGEVIYDMSVAGNPLVGTVLTCGPIAGISESTVALVAPTPGGLTVTGNDNLVFATPATASWTTDSAIPIMTCANIYGTAVYDSTLSSGPIYIGAEAGCGGLVTLTAPALHDSSGSTDNLVPATPATSSWALHDLTINVASCTGFASPQVVADMTLTTPTVIGTISGCAGTSLALVSPGATVASVGSADNLAVSTQSTSIGSTIPAGGSFSWSNAVRHIPVPNCVGAGAADAVLDLSLSGMPIIGTIGACGSTMLINAPPLTASADIEGYLPAPSLDYLLITQRRQGDYRINQHPVPGGFSLWAGTSNGTFQTPAAPVALDPAGAAWAFGNFAQTNPVAIAALPTCGASNIITAGVITTVAAGTYGSVNNGVAPPTYWGAVSTTGAATDSVYCYYSGSAYSWVYR